MAATKRDFYNKKSLGGELNSLVKEARVLMVGAGGIGCELLKNLVLTGFGEVHLVDLDTIDLSNLNRQFLFRNEHIKKSKALVAREAAQKFNPNVKLIAHHANIKDTEFSVDWFKGFTMVLNALDNIDARRHVNKMCLAANVPLIESGTTGFNGQVQVIKKGITACYDCTVKETPKSFPVCTIRSTPSQPIHCIVWGKSYLLSEVFGTSQDESPELDNSEDSENAEELKKLKEEAEALKKIKEAMGLEQFPQLLFDKVYKHDIDRLLSMQEMWKTRKAPSPLSYADVTKSSDFLEVHTDQILKSDQRAWTLHENVAVFKDSLDRLSKRLLDMKSDGSGNSADPIITFDKDDEDTLDFVTAAANLRSIVFGIETKSRFDIKQMAGNIIPAIATTNAIIAGLCVLQAFKVLRGDFSSAKEVFLSPFAPQRLLSSDHYREPTPECPVCSPAQTRILVDPKLTTLGDVVEELLRSQFGYGEEFTVNNEVGTLYDVDETENLDKKLADLGINDGSFLTVIDEDEERPRVNLLLSVQAANTEMEGAAIKSLDIQPTIDNDALDVLIPRRKLPAANPLNGNTSNGAATSGLNGSATKRSASDMIEPGSPLAKRPKTLSTNDTAMAVETNGKATEPILVDDNGAILIDD